MQTTEDVVGQNSNGSAVPPTSEAGERNLNGNADAQGLADLLHALQAMRVGDFSVRMAGDQIGIMGKIADTFNEIVGTNRP
jgi:hypothetical protein